MRKSKLARTRVLGVYLACLDNVAQELLVSITAAGAELAETLRDGELLRRDVVENIHPHDQELMRHQHGVFKVLNNLRPELRSLVGSHNSVCAALRDKVVGFEETAQTGPSEAEERLAEDGLWTNVSLAQEVLQQDLEALHRLLNIVDNRLEEMKELLPEDMPKPPRRTSHLRVAND
jgi:hypothetical protein